MILDRTWTGFGYDAFAPAFELYRAAPLVAENYVDLAHNSYLALWSEQGILIGSIPMVLIAWSFWMIVQHLRAQQGDFALNIAALGVIVLGAVHSMADFSLEIPANNYCFLLIVGLAIARPRVPVPDGDKVVLR
jgi:O-antigen ligase